MIRTCKTHDVRKQMELTESLWEFEPCAGNYAGQKFPVAVPGCWESHPLFADYSERGFIVKLFRHREMCGSSVKV